MADDLLRHEVAARTGVALRTGGSLDSATAAIIIGQVGAVPTVMPTPPTGLAVPEKAEGYAIWVDTATRPAPTVCLLGRDARGCLYAAGRLLRALHMQPGVVNVDKNFRVASAPEYPVRGHHVGYDSMNNTFDAWDIDQFEQYCRDLVVFGTNAMELCPSLDPTLKNSPHMKRTMWDMNVEMSRVAGRYGMDVWAFVPILEDIAKPEIAEQEMQKRIALFKAMPCLDAVMVPGGDPGDTDLPALLPFLQRLASELRAIHPGAGVWLSNQGFPAEKNDAFFAFLAKEQPDWLAGLVFGPWTKITLDEMRARTPKKYPIRDYTDFTHCIRSQYPVPEWDPAFPRTLGREPVNPLPEAMRRLYTRFAPLTIGSIPYSEGVNDDFNKVAWSLLGWDSTISAIEIEREYGHYFAGPKLGDAVGKGYAALEQNWKGPLLKNTKVAATHNLWLRIEREAGEKEFNSNWRLQQGLLRACYDEYVQRRLKAETAREKAAIASLAKAGKLGVPKAVAGAREALARPDTDPRIPELRARLVALGRTIFDTIGMQLDVTHYKALNPERGAVLEFLDAPLNNREWLEDRFDALASMPAAEAMAEVGRIVNWERPGPGSFYDDLGHAGKQPHLVRPADAAQDPGGVVSPMEEFSNIKRARLSWQDQEQTLFGAPLRMRYENLDPNAQYRLRVTYTGRFKPTMRLVANGTTEIHGPLKQPDPVAPVEFGVPRSATAGGSLALEWQLVDGRGCQVAEVWLIRQ